MLGWGYSAASVVLSVSLGWKHVLLGMGWLEDGLSWCWLQWALVDGRT